MVPACSVARSLRIITTTIPAPTAPATAMRSQPENERVASPPRNNTKPAKPANIQSIAAREARSFSQTAAMMVAKIG